MVWIELSLLAMLAAAAKAEAIKRAVAIDALTLLFFSRLAAFLLLLPWLAGSRLPQEPQFWLVTLTTVVLTLLAGLMQIRALHEGELTRVAPMQALVPVLMLPFTALIFGEYPAPLALFFLLGVVGGLSVLLGGGEWAAGGMRPLLLMLGATLLYALCTVLDRVAIAAAPEGAYSYSLIWNGISALLLALLLRRRPTLSPDQGRLLLPVVLATAVAFVAQQYAVQTSLSVANGVTYVKAIVMLNIALLLFAGVFLFGEQQPRRKQVAALVATLSAIGLLLAG